MSQQTIAYNPSSIAVEGTAITVTTAAEVDLLKITDGKYLPKSQLTFYYSVNLGAAGTLKLRYYGSIDGGTTWFPMPIKNLGNGELTDTPSVIDSNSYASGGNALAYESIPMPACTAFKVTGIATGNSVTVNTAAVFVRDN